MYHNGKKERAHSVHEEFLHPNMIKEAKVSETGERPSLVRKRKQFNSCKSCFKRFDELILKPWLIHNYDKVLLSRREEFFDMFKKDGENWEKTFVEEKIDPNAA
jgi:hypothetical protein